MVLDNEARQILEILAKEYEDTLETRFKGVPFRVLGARAGAYLDFPLYSVHDLETAGFVRRIGRDRVLLTEKGYRFARPPHRRVLNLFRERPVLYVSIAVTTLSIIVGIALLLRGCAPG